MTNQPEKVTKTRVEEFRTTDLRQAVFRLDRLTYPQKFILITIIFLVPLIAFVPLAMEQSTYIQRYGYKENQGTNYLRVVWQTKDSIQTLQYTMDEYIQGTKSLGDVEKAKSDAEERIQELEIVDQEYGESLALNFDINDLKTQWLNLKNSEPDETSARKAASILSLIDGVTKEVGDASYLILDPDLDTYYMMDTVLLNMPESQDLLFEIFILSNRVVRNQSITPEDEAQLAVLIGRLETNINDLEANIQTAIQNNSAGTILPLINRPSQNFINAVKTFKNLIEDNLAGDQLPQLSSDVLEQSFLDTQQVSNAFYNSSADALSIGIQDRITRLSTRLYTVMGLAIVSVLVAFTIGLSIMRSISSPLSQLFAATEKISAGDMSARVQIESGGELGRVARSFNQMAQELDAGRITSIARTRELEIAQQQSEFRAKQLQVVTELAVTITQVHNIGELFPITTTLISEKFNFYHVGIFLVDSDREYAILQAANSEGGQRMLARGHKLKLGTGVVGFSAQTGRPRIALDVGTDAVFFNNPDLPDTRSEIALPLTSRGETIGVLDVQSTVAGAFTAEDLQVLTTLANQVSIAYENARLLNETRAALTQVQEVYNEFTRTEWSRTVSSTEQHGFRYQSGRIEMLEDTLRTSEVVSAVESGGVVANQTNGSKEKRASMAVPVKLRGEVIGVLHIESNDFSKEWQADEISLVEAVAERAAFAMENARLFQDARRRAAKEQLISDATSRISGISNLENILKTTAEELEKVLGGSEILIQFQGKEAQE